MILSSHNDDVDVLRLISRSPMTSIMQDILARFVLSMFLSVMTRNALTTRELANNWTELFHRL
jgi:hypothetical protein